MNEYNIKKACFTGYRPEKFDYKLNNGNPKYKLMASRLIETIESLYNDGCKVFYCGMAPGFDIVASECVLKIKRQHSDIRLVCAIPYLGHESSISFEWKKRYNNVLKHSDEVVYVTENYHVSCFQLRNQYMVDLSDCVICWYDGRTGGTKNTINYAQKNNKYILNVNVEYEKELNSLQNKMNF